MLTTAEVIAHRTDPTLDAALTANNDIAAADRLSQLLTEVVPVSIPKLAAWAAQTGVRAAVHDAANNPTSTLRSIAMTALDLIRGGVSPTFDTVAHGALLDAMQTGGLMTAANRAALTALATRNRTITPNEVAHAVRNDNGSSKL